TKYVTLRLYPIVTTTTTTTSTTTTTILGKCAGYCGGKSPYGCWCDEKCVTNGDCCDDVCRDCPSLSFCGGTTTTTTTTTTSTTTTIAPQYCTIIVTVYNGSISTPLSEATITLDGGNIRTTTSTGQVIYYNVPLGQHVVYGTKSGHYPDSQNIYCSCSETKYVTLRLYPIVTTTTTTTTTSTIPTTTTTLPQYCTIKVTALIDYTNESLSGVNVTLDGTNLKITPSNGTVTYENILLGQHTIHGTIANYYPDTRTVYCCCSNTTVESILRLYPIATSNSTIMTSSIIGTSSIFFALAVIAMVFVLLSYKREEEELPSEASEDLL
ncbi:MAG: hypothetical protein QXQ40_02530, partial [Candidatus Aenigmatarchaeota archaeon]